MIQNSKKKGLKDLAYSENLNKNEIFYNRIADLLKISRNNLIHTVNTTMVYTYYEIGKAIVEEEQRGKQRAEYGKQLLKGLSNRLSDEFGKGFSLTNLKQMRQFYLIYSKGQTPSDLLGHSNSSKALNQISEDMGFNLSWSHYIFLIRIVDPDERKFYELEAFNNKWSLRELERQFDTALFERLSLIRDKSGVKELTGKGQIIDKPKDTVKDPYILEFLGLNEETQYSESELEQKIIDKLESFLMELGKGFTFVGRQVRFTFEHKNFRVDLVFYNRILKCFVLIDLKIGEICHQDLGQMQMYVNYYDRKVKLEDENKTIGIILCKNKNEALVEMTLPENNKQIFASKYKIALPSKEELKALIENKNPQ